MWRQVLTCNLLRPRLIPHCFSAVFMSLQNSGSMDEVVYMEACSYNQNEILIQILQYDCL